MLGSLVARWNAPLAVLAAIATIAATLIFATQFFVHIAYFDELFGKNVRSEPPTPTPTTTKVDPKDSSHPSEGPASPSGPIHDIQPAVPGPFHPKADGRSAVDRDNAVEGIQLRPLADTLLIEPIEASEMSLEPFPVEHLKGQLTPYLEDSRTRLKTVRIGIAFVEPTRLRELAHGSTTIGYISATLPDLAGCSMTFGPPTEYRYASVAAGIATAVDAQAGSIADWIKRATVTGGLKCPSN